MQPAMTVLGVPRRKRAQGGAKLCYWQGADMFNV